MNTPSDEEQHDDEHWVRRVDHTACARRLPGWTLYGVFVLSLTGFVWIVVLAWNRRPRRTWHVPAWLAGLVVATIVTLVLALVGMLLVRRETIEQWTELQDSDWNPLVAVTVAGHEYPLTSETILMSILLGVFAAMQFAASIMTDAELQKVYFKGVYDDAREVLAVRARYREYLSRHG